MSTDIASNKSILSDEISTITQKEFDMKYNPYDDETIENRRTGRPPLPADAKYREQRQRGVMFETLDEDDDAYYQIAPQKFQHRIP